MRKHGWQLPYHPLQVVAVAVFLSLGFAFYVFFAPFVGRKMFQFIFMGIYTPLIATSFCLYITCAATDPADCAVFKSKKYLNDKAVPTASCEEGAFYCSLCEIEVLKYSKHCRVCDKCVDRFDHHCRWLNNCVGRRNYSKFFALMVSALVLLVLQWATGVLVLVLCFLDRKHYSTVVPAKLGSSFSLVPFVIVVGICTGLAMVATLPLAQLFFFHVLLVKKGITTYDYIIALRDQDHEQRGQQSPIMSQASSITGLSSTSSFTAFHRAAWCTPPRLFLEDQFDVVPPETASVSSRGKTTTTKEDIKKKVAPVKISPWALARLDPEQVSKAAEEAKKRSKILKPVDGEGSVKRGGKRGRVPAEGFFGTSSSLVPLQLEARRAMSGSARMVTSSPESSLNSPDVLPFRVSSFGAGDSKRVEGFAVEASPVEAEGPGSRSSSDGYEASGGEDSDRVPTRIVQRSTNWSELYLRGEEEDGIGRFLAAESSRYGK